MADNDVKEEQKTDAQTPENTAKDAVAAETVADATATDENQDPAAPAQGRRVKSGKVIASGIAYVNATFNNTKVTITDLNGNALCWSSGGKMGMKGSRKSTAYAAQQVANDAARKAQAFGMREVEVRIKGPGAGRESAVRGIAAAGLEITALKDITPVPHNGCRPPKRRRV
jgi:small subunit ribosomal protein S11